MPLVVLHTSESDVGTAYPVAAYLTAKNWMSHEVYDPSNGDLIHLLPADVPARSLMNLPGGVETNARPDTPYQIEIVGRAASTPFYDANWYANLREHLIVVCAALSCPYDFPLPFPVHAPGLDNGYRISFADWPSFHGIIGHVHVPENDHYDPGALDITQLEDTMTPEAYCRMIDARYGTPDACTRVVNGVVEMHLKNRDGSDAGWWALADVWEFNHRQTLPL